MLWRLFDDLKSDFFFHFDDFKRIFTGHFDDLKSDFSSHFDDLKRIFDTEGRFSDDLKRILLGSYSHR